MACSLEANPWEEQSRQDSLSKNKFTRVACDSYQTQSNSTSLQPVRHREDRVDTPKSQPGINCTAKCPFVEVFAIKASDQGSEKH